jgi:hypothetical protein
MLKTEEARKISSTSNEEEENKTRKTGQRTIPRQQGGSMFRRF